MTTAVSAHALEFDRADRMRKALRVAGVSVSEMAEYLGLQQNSITAYINGHTPADTRTLRLFALRCGVPLEWLRDGVAPQSDDPGDGTIDGRASSSMVELRTFNPKMRGLAHVAQSDFLPLKIAS